MKQKNDGHVTAYMPQNLIDEVDTLVETIGLSRSYAVRQGLILFLRANRQKITKSVKQSDRAPKRRTSQLDESGLSGQTQE